MAGSTRDLSTIEAHIERMDAWCRELWECKSIDLKKCDGSTASDQFGLLQDIRHDVGAVLSELRSRGQ